MAPLTEPHMAGFAAAPKTLSELREKRATYVRCRTDWIPRQEDNRRSDWANHG
jgi:hypothetical protein